MFTLCFNNHKYIGHIQCKGKKINLNKKKQDYFSVIGSNLIPIFTV
jgi:hypothetical protein